MTYYLTQVPTFLELAEMCKRIDNTIDLADKHIDIVSMETGEVYANRHQCNMWEVCNYAENIDALLAKKHKYDKMLNRGLITYAQYEKFLYEEMEE